MVVEFTKKLFSAKTGKTNDVFPRPNFIPSQDDIKVETKKGPNLDSFEAAAEAQKEEYTYDDYLVDLYIKVGLFCNWSWQDFENTEIKVVQKINSRIDKKIDEEQIINYQHLVLLLVMSKVLGGK